MSTPAPADPRRRLLYWTTLTRDEQARAICELANSGLSDHDISILTAWNVQGVRQVLAERRPPTEV